MEATGVFFYGVSLLASGPTPFSRLLRQAGDTMDLFYPRSIGVSERSIFFLQVEVIGQLELKNKKNKKIKL